jgi:hypothetical protein
MTVTLPRFLNGNEIALRIRVLPKSIYAHVRKGELKADAIYGEDKPLFLASRVEEIAAQLLK